MKFYGIRGKIISALAVFALAVLAFAGGRFFLPEATSPEESKPVQNQEALPPSGLPPLADETAVITKVLDGDTVVISGGDHVRLLGIDADEPGYPCYAAAKKRLEELVLGKTAVLERDNENLDQYSRKLRYIFLDGKNINTQMAAEGLAIARFYPENQKYKNEIAAAEAQALENKTGCKWEGSGGL